MFVTQSNKTVQKTIDTENSTEDNEQNIFFFWSSEKWFTVLWFRLAASTHNEQTMRPYGKQRQNRLVHTNIIRVIIQLSHISFCGFLYSLQSSEALSYQSNQLIVLEMTISGFQINLLHEQKNYIYLLLIHFIGYF